MEHYTDVGTADSVAAVRYSFPLLVRKDGAIYLWYTSASD